MGGLSDEDTSTSCEPTSHTLLVEFIQKAQSSTWAVEDAFLPVNAWNTARVGVVSNNL